MTTGHIRIAVKRIAVTFALTAYAGLLQIVIAATDNGALASGTGASEAIRGALDNARHRYNQALDYYGLSELYYGETRGICNLQLDMPGRAAPLQILYVRADNSIQYPQVMPKGLAQQLISDRMLIDSYQRVLRADEARANRLTPEQAKAWHEFRKANPDLSLAHAISKFSMQNDVSKNKLRNYIGEEKEFKDMTDEERSEYMKGDMYKVLKEQEQRERQMRREEREREKEESERQMRNEGIERRKAERRAEWNEIANTASSDDIRAAIRDQGDADYFLELRRKKKQGVTLTEKEQENWDKFVDRLSHLPYFRRNRRDGAQSTPRSTRYRDDEEKARVMNAFYESRANYSRKKDEKVQPSMRGKRVLEQRATQGRKPYHHNAPRSGNGLSISGNRRGKLTLTGK